MSDVAIRTEKLGKMYRLGVFSQHTYSGYDFLGFDLPLQRLWPVLFPTGQAEAGGDGTFWALKDLDLEVRRGEVVGIVGRNGSGKSTLLKILARVTEPTTGFAEVTGQVGSLLEVGTGFHPELTGRQNLYLNGSIMGMSYEQITRRLDEIVAFAEVERFIDTPVKHYSSGMYMRLAFSVAAHMECDSLMVDEVLAVGDAHFQRKCLGRIDSEVKSGKTVLFVSHNTSMIMQVCTRCILLDNGRCVEDGPPQPIIESYLSRNMFVHSSRVWNEDDGPTSPERCFRLRAIRILDSVGNNRMHYDVKEPVFVEVEWDVLDPRLTPCIQLHLRHESGVTVLVSMENCAAVLKGRASAVGHYRAHCVIPANFLNEGLFSIDYHICAMTRQTEFLSCQDAASFYVIDDMKAAGVRGTWDRAWPTSVLRPQLQWVHFEHCPMMQLKAANA